MMNARQIQDHVCAAFDMTRDQLLQPDKARRFSRPRQIAMFLCREYTPLSYPDLGQIFCRDHTTVLFAVRACERRQADEIDGPVIAKLRIEICDRQARDRARQEHAMRTAWAAQAMTTRVAGGAH